MRPERGFWKVVNPLANRNAEEGAQSYTLAAEDMASERAQNHLYRRLTECPSARSSANDARRPQHRRHHTNGICRVEHMIQIAYVQKLSVSNVADIGGLK